jgi:hypothetical protein
MVHLSVAHCLIRDHGYPESGEFYLGNIAPDAIHVRPGTEGQDKRAVHLFGPDGLRREPLRALLAQGRPLATGYVVHVLTDQAWRAEILLPFRRPRVERMPYPELRTLYYNETDKLDLDLYDEQPWRPAVWEQLQRARAEDVGLEGEPPLLTADEIDAWRVRTLGWFDVHREKAGYQPQYITRELVWPFIPKTAAQIAAQLSD